MKHQQSTNESRGRESELYLYGCRGERIPAHAKLLVIRAVCANRLTHEFEKVGQLLRRMMLTSPWPSWSVLVA